MTDNISPAAAGRLRPALWLVLVLSLAANAITSTIGATAISVVFGLITLACATALVLHHYRNRP
jgi:hypothetical protein